METVPYVYLKKADSDGDNFQLLGPSSAGQKVTLERENIPRSAIADLEQDESTIAGAPEMPLALIAPSETGGTDSVQGWGIDAVGAEASTYDGKGVTVAVLDTGIDQDHPAFAGVDLVCKNFTQSDDQDTDGHGTHCAGTIFGRDTDRRIGIARGVERALIAKVIGEDGGSSPALIDAMLWSSRNGANIISMSLGFDFPGMVANLVSSGWPTELATSTALEAYRKNQRLFDRVMSLMQAQAEFGRGAVVVAASGNESRRGQSPNFRIAASLPSAADNVISVGALQRSPNGLTVADFSNSLPTVAAPGVAIESAWLGSDHQTLDGTSMACPHVAGVAALWWQSLEKAASPEATKERVLSSATYDQLALGYDHTDVGKGLVQAP